MATTPADPAPQVLTINGGSSSIKFALFTVGTVGTRPERLLAGQIDRIGRPGASLSARGTDGLNVRDLPVKAANHAEASDELAAWLESHRGPGTITGIGHRLVFGGAELAEHQLVTPELLAELHRAEPLALTHLPREIALVEAFIRNYPNTPQVACFDTVFHHNLPRIAQLLPIPRRYLDAGIRRFGFHGLSYTYLMEELGRSAGSAVAGGKVILAHLGSGASMAAVRDGRPIETSMGFTPTAGLMMGTRPGDLDPGLLLYLMQTDQKSPQEMDVALSSQFGLLGVSGTTSDMRDLLAARKQDVRAAEAVDLFCYLARRWLGSLATALGGVDTLVFSGGIGEHGPEVRAGICDGLEFLGVRLDVTANTANAPVISAPDSTVSVRVIPTNEELVMAQAICRLVEQPARSTHG